MEAWFTKTATLRRMRREFAAVLVTTIGLQAMVPALAAVAFEAELGTLGSNFTNGSAGAVQFISISTDTVNNGNPGNANRVASYSVTFPSAGIYKLYGRVRVTSGGAAD